MLESLPASKVLPDADEFSTINQLLDKWLHLTGTVDSDIARYQVWRHITELVEDLEPSNPRLWNRGILPLQRQLQKPEYAPPRSISIREPTFNHHQLPPYPPHWVVENDNYFNQPQLPVAPAPDDDLPT